MIEHDRHTIGRTWRCWWRKGERTWRMRVIIGIKTLLKGLQLLGIKQILLAKGFFLECKKKSSWAHLRCSTSRYTPTVGRPILKCHRFLPTCRLLLLPETIRNGQERRDFADFAFSAVFGNEAAVDRSTFMRLYPHFALHPDKEPKHGFCPEWGIDPTI